MAASRPTQQLVLASALPPSNPEQQPLVKKVAEETHEPVVAPRSLLRRITCNRITAMLGVTILSLAIALCAEYAAINCGEGLLNCQAAKAIVT